MPATTVYFYREGDSVPVLDWLRELAKRDKKAFDKCRVRIQLLAENGSELRRPVADFLDNGIYELRISHKRQNFRILYAFVGQNVTLLTNGLTKEDRVPPAEIAKAIERRKRYESNPTEHRYETGETS